MSIRVAIIDDHKMMRTALRAVLSKEPDFSIVAEAGDSETGLLAVEETSPDVVILDLVLPPGGGLKVIPDIKRVSPTSRVLVVTSQDDPETLREAMLAGGSGYVVKKTDVHEIATAIRNVHEGRVFMVVTHSHELKPMLFNRQTAGRSRGEPDHLANLTDRERSVLELVARGYTSQKIAEMLFLSVKTIETYRSRVASKLNLKDRAEVVQFAVDFGLLRPSGT